MPTSGKHNFAQSTMSQIADSKKHGLKQLYVLLAGDLTNKSHLGKVRDLQSRVSQLNDAYVVVVPPERVWTLLF
jgi:hypothetical protein